MTQESDARHGPVIAHSYGRREDGLSAVERLRGAGFTNEEISVVGQGSPGSGEVPDEAVDAEAEAGEGAVKGAVAGGFGAGMATLVAGTFLFAATGPLALVLAPAGAVAGGIAGALTKLGMSESEAQHYRERLEAGDTVVAVHAGDREEEARQALLKAEVE
ncbi:MAG: hypothetical protein WD208_03595 [Dehalococcoidia bacterium]